MSLRLTSLGTGAMMLVVLSCPRPARADDAKRACVDASTEGQSLRDAGKLRQARDRFVTCARDECPAVVRKYCVDWLADMEHRIPTVAFVAQTADGQDVTGARLTIDGTPQTSAFGATVPIDPGEHVVHVERPSGEVVDENVVIVEGEKGRVVTLHFPAAAAPNVPERASPGEASTPDTATRFTPRTLAFGGIGLLGLAGFTYFGLTATSGLNHLRQTCAPNCAQSDVQSVKTEALAADISLGVGIVALGIATYMFLSHSEAPPAASLLEVEPRTGGAAIDFHLAF
jgi:hypothetical protein